MDSARRTAALPAVGFPIRTSPDQSLVSGSPKLIAATRVLHRLLSPRHPSCALGSLVIVSSRSRFRDREPPRRPRSSSGSCAGLTTQKLRHTHKCLLVSCAYAVVKDRKSLGGADRDRTDDIQLAKFALSQLSYGPAAKELVGLDRFELSTPRLSSVCSNQLSYRPSPSPGSYGPESPPSKSKIRRSPFGPSKPDSKPTLISRNHASRGSRELRALTCRCRTRFRL